MQTAHGVFIFLTLPLSVICLGTGYCTGRFFAPKEVVVNATEVTTSNRVVDVSSEDAQRLSRALEENERLRRQLAQFNLTAEENKAELVALEDKPANPEAREERRPRSFREVEEEMKKQNPEAYQRMVEGRARFLEMRRNERDARLGFLESVDMNLLTPEEQGTHAAYLNAVQRQAELEEFFMTARETGVEPTMEDREAMREAVMDVQTLREEENILLLSALGTVWNIPEEELDAFVKSVETVNQALARDGMRGPGPRFRGPEEGRPPRGE